MIGDIIGRPGREAIERILPELRAADGIDFVILATGMFGIAEVLIGVTAFAVALVFDQAEPLDAMLHRLAGGADAVELGHHGLQLRGLRDELAAGPTLPAARAGSST